jgi:hypothetical protein
MVDPKEEDYNLKQVDFAFTLLYQLSQMAQTLFFCSYASYIMYLLKGRLQWRNYAIVICFYAFILLRNITCSVLYWHTTDQGNLQIKDIKDLRTV